MTAAQINATFLLCRLLEQRKPEIGGLRLFSAEFRQAARDLLHERLLSIRESLSWITCPECGTELARVVRETGDDQALMLCHECGEFPVDRNILKTYAVEVTKVVTRLAISLDLPPISPLAIEAERSWRLGITEPQRAKPLTWYFARNLHDPAVARRLLDHVKANSASRSARIITSTELPLPTGSPLTEYNVSNLSAISRVSQNRFVFFQERTDLPPTITPARESPQTSLVDLRDRSVAYVSGRRFDLEPMQREILLALIDDFDHRMDLAQLRTACESSAEIFSPSKYFVRNRPVYKAFIKYIKGDQEYVLVISNEDRPWLT